MSGVEEKENEHNEGAEMTLHGSARPPSNRPGYTNAWTPVCEGSFAVLPADLRALRERRGFHAAFVLGATAAVVGALMKGLRAGAPPAQPGLRALGITDDALQLLCGYDWPGNVRQVHNVIETMLILAPNDRNEPIDLDLLPVEIHNVTRSSDETEMDKLMGLPLRGAREEFERAYLVSQLHRFDGNVSRVASFIGMERSALHRKLKALNIASDHQEGERKE